mgnify:FL=1
MTLDGALWVVTEVGEETVTLVSADPFTEEEGQDLEALLRKLLKKEHLKKLLADETTGERAFPADEETAEAYFEGEAGHIAIRAEKDVLKEGLVFDANGILSRGRILLLEPDNEAPVYFCFDKESLLSPWPVS